MTDIVEQAARVLSTQTTCDGEPHPTEVHRRQAQALADAGLLAQPARTVPTREQIVDVILDTHLFDGGTPIDTADAILELLAGQPTVAEVKAEALEDLAREATDNTELDKTDRHLISNWCIVAAQQIRDEPPSLPTLKTRPQPTELHIEWKRGAHDWTRGPLPPRYESAPVEAHATCAHCGTVTVTKFTAPGRIPQPLLKCDCQQYRDGK